ncbi:MAG: hypothetical protein NWE80_04780 [Candidatus Bathyarchaeota archaeon]|nr:hypothetical protein [Candidatus Bathyarchaeota archaeon]
MANENNTKRVSELNSIFKELIDNAKSFANDIVSSIYLYYFAGILSILFGLQTGWYNRSYVLGGDLIPMFLVIAQILLGAVIVLRGYGLKKKYSRIFELKKKL